MALTQTNPTNVTPQYAARNNQGTKRPVYYVKFGLVTGPLGTNSQAVPYQFCTGPIQNSTMNRFRYMSSPTSAPNTINLITYVASLSQITFALSDINGLITTMCGSFIMKNRLVTIYKGYEDIDEAYYSSIYTGQINDWQLSQDGTQYIFMVTDPQKQLTTDILKGHSQLVADFNPGDSVIYMTTSFYFPQSTDLQDGQGPRNYIIINDCLFSYTGNASRILIDNFVTWAYVGQGVVSASTPQWTAGKGYYLDGPSSPQLRWAYIGPVTSSLSPTAWAINTSYSIGNQVQAGGNAYQCVIPGTSAPSGVGPNSIGYVIGNKVFNLGNVYQCVVAGTSSDQYSIDNTVLWKWVSAGVPTSTILQWTSGTPYTATTYVYNLGNIYVCIAAGTSGSGVGPSGIAQGPAGYGSTASALYGVQQVVLNGNGAANSQQHQAGSNVDNYILFQGNPITIMLQIIMSTGTGANYSETGTNYDVLPASQGIGIPWNLVNISNFVSQMNTFVSWFYFSNYFITATSALQFFQNQIFQQCQCFTFTNKSGQLDLKMVYFPLPITNYTQIDDTNIIGIPQFDASLQTGNNFVNEVDVLFDYQPVSDFYVNETITINNSSQQTYEEEAIQEVDCQFVATYYQGQNIVKRLTNIMLNLYGNPLPVIVVKCFAQLQTVNPGDTILFASSQTPNLKTGLRGGTVLCLCIASAPDFQNDQCTLTLYAFGYASNKRYAVIGPAGMPSYASASNFQKNYFFISQLVTGNFSVGQMLDGTDGYYIAG